MIRERVPAIYSGIARLACQFRLPTNSSEEVPTVRPAIAILKGSGSNIAATPTFASLSRMKHSGIGGYVKGFAGAHHPHGVSSRDGLTAEGLTDQRSLR